MELISLCWDGTAQDYNLHNITTANSGKTETSNEASPFRIDFEAGWLGTPNDFALGNYKVSAIIDDQTYIYFYIDYRTSSLPESFNVGGGGDVVIDFNIDNSNLQQSKFYYNSTISVLLNEIKEEGEHSLEFDGTNLPSGIYLCRMIAGNFIETSKLILLK